MRTAGLNLLSLLFIAVPSIGQLISPNQAWAGSQTFTEQSNCTTLNCAGLTMGGTYVYEQPFSQALPYTVQLFSAGNECIRVAVIYQQTDLEATLVGPDGQFWIDDDSNGNLSPRIVARTTRKGWYALQIARHDGAGPGSNFTFKYGRYPLSNPNCALTTTTLRLPSNK